jgi:hypothetical protein
VWPPARAALDVRRRRGQGGEPPLPQVADVGLVQQHGRERPCHAEPWTRLGVLGERVDLQQVRRHRHRGVEPAAGQACAGHRRRVDRVADPTPERSPRFDDELLGLDPDDPDAQAFAAHLDRMQRQGPAFTVEGYLDGVRTFADSANRAEGGRRWAAVVLAGLLLVVAGYVVFDALMFVVRTWL